MTSRPRVAVAGLPVLAVTVLLGACAGTGPGSPAPDAPTATPRPTAAPTPAPTPAPEPGTPAGTDSALTISVSDGSGAGTTWRLTCDPPGGDHPDPAAACRALDGAADTALPPVPSDVACAEVYAGPETATVTGTWRGQPVDSRLSRTNSCETARWDALAAVLLQP